MTLGHRLKQLRKERNYKADYVAEQIGVSRSALYFWENNTNEPKANYLQKLAAFYEISIDDLLINEECPECTMHTVPVVFRSKNNTETKRMVEITDEQYKALQQIIEEFDKNKELK